MRLFLTAILTVLCFATQVLSEEKIVFENPEQIYIDLDGFKNCKLENAELNGIIIERDNLIDISNKQIVLLKSGLDLCNSYKDKLDLSIIDLKELIVNQNNVSQIQPVKFTNNIKTIGISVLVGFLLGTSIHFAY